MNNNELMKILSLVNKSSRNKKLAIFFGTFAFIGLAYAYNCHQKKKAMKSSLYFLDGKLKYYNEERKQFKSSFKEKDNKIQSLHEQINNLILENKKLSKEENKA